MPVSVFRIMVGMFCGVALACPSVFAQAAAPTDAKPVEAAAPAIAGQTDGVVQLNFPENVSLKVLIDYVGARQGINFIYDATIAAKTVTIKAPQSIPSDSLLTLLDTVLKTNNLMMTPTDVRGTMRIEQNAPLTNLTTQVRSSDQAVPPGRPTLVLTQLFQFKHVSVKRMQEILTPFISGGAGNLVALPEHNMLIVTDFSDKMKRLEDLIAVADRPSQDVRFITIKYMEANDVAQQVNKLLAGKAKARGLSDANAQTVTLVPDARSNQVAVVGQPNQLDEVADLIRSLDVSLGMTTKVYNFKAASADQVDRLVKKLVGEVAAKRFYKSATDHDMNLLIATTTPEIHEQIESLKQTLDKPAADSQSPIRFYKLQNAKAADVLDTLQSIEGDDGLDNVSVDGVTGEQAKPDDYQAINGPTDGGISRVTPPGGVAEKEASQPEKTRKSVRLRNARVMADEPSNSIIIVASPSMQVVYQKLIERLDVRRPQVLVEATVVSIDTTDGFELGVEISKSGTFDGGDGKTLSFSSFGLSTVNAGTGGLTLKPGVGFNGAVLSSDIANIVIHALESDGRVKVVSRPSVLINDNAKGILDSVSKVPYASVNASTTVATTSLGGYAEAGTKVTITPQISEGDHLKLTYSIELSSFGDTTSETLPPSQQTNSLESEVTIPDGYTIVVGGLRQDHLTETVDRIPLVGRIPVLEYLFSNRSTETKQSTLFVFIHAVVLRDDKFEDLKVVSDNAAISAELATHYPASEPVEVH